ncbi:glycosyltransferase family 2 protein [Microbacterium sp. NPDC019599]|uniref:glycosyltransferase family 2 protein n=1 Tax=Microbacterium sp. NPDC019599 TaxID=3154690 RepID=UPI0033CCAEC3
MEQYATVIISYRRPDLLDGVLERLQQQTVPPALVVIVDNAGDLDVDALTLGGLADRVSVVRRPDNPGYSAAANIGLAAAADHGLARLLVLTHDAQFGPQLAEGLLSAFGGATTVGASAPLLRWAEQPDKVFSAGGRLTRWGRAWNTVEPASATEPYTVDWADGAIVLFDVAALQAIGGMDESYFLYFEDVDTSWRLRRAGFATTVSPDVIAYQQPGAHPMYLGIRNMALFSSRAGIAAPASALATARRVAEESLVRVLRRRRPELGAAWRGWRDGRRGVSGHPAARG